MIPPFKRVVSGQKPDGTSVWTHVEDVEPIVFGDEPRWAGMWGWDEPPTLPYLKTDPYYPRSTFPGADHGQLRVNMVVIPAGSNVKAPMAHGEVPEEFRRLAEAQDFGLVIDPETGMHTTDTVDIAFVISGEVVIATHDQEVTMTPGTVYIQNGAEHAWRNYTDEPCTLGFVVIGAPRSGGAKAT